MKKTKITFKSEFHNSESSCMARPSSKGGYLISINQFKRLKRELCGVSDCCCDPLYHPDNECGIEVYHEYAYIFKKRDRLAQGY